MVTPTSGADQAHILNLYGQPKGEPISFIVPDATAIEKGDIISGQDLYRGAKSTIDNRGGFVCGIAATEKEASDGNVTIGCNTKGVFDMRVASGCGVAVGDWVHISGAAGNPNSISGVTIVTDAETKKGLFGRALEVGTEGEVIAVRLGSN